MATVRYSLDPSSPPRLSDEERIRLAAMTDEEIERNALDDPDNPLIGPSEGARFATATMIRRIRQGTGLPQAQFAARYRINLARLRDWEQGRFVPDSAALAYLTVIEKEPEAVGRALVAVD